MPHWIDGLTQGIAPRWTLKRQRARLAGELMARHFEGAAAGRRTSGWNRTSGDANAAILGASGRLRDVARDLVRNNCYADSALTTIVDHTVSWGLTAKPSKSAATAASRNRAADRWKAWAETPACDADGRHDLYGLQDLVMRTVVESGEVLVRRRVRRPEDNLPIPLQLQILEPDYLDSMKEAVIRSPEGTVVRRIVQGVEFDALGRRSRYWLFPEHPGSNSVGASSGGASQSIPASEILHIFRQQRPGQVRGASWFAPVILRMKDFDEFEDATLMKQKIAACLAIITSDIDGSSPAIGSTTETDPLIDSLQPGMILNAAPGRSISVVQPPTVNDYGPYTSVNLHAIATGLGVTYEDLTGNYENLPFSAARMSRLRHAARVHSWRWKMLIPQFCDPVWAWAMEAAVITGLPEAPTATWTAPPMAMLQPDEEARAYIASIRAGLTSHPEVIRELGGDPDETLAEIEEWQKKIHGKGLIFDSDASATTQAGLPREPATAKAATSPNGNGIPATNGAHG